jgi:pyochelin synthetase
MRDPVGLPAAQLARRREANATAAPTRGRLLHQDLIDACRARPQATAVISPHGPMTFGQLLQRAGAIAHRLSSQAPDAREPVAIVLPKGPDQIAAVLGALLAGRPYLPIDTHQPAVRRAAILNDAGVSDVVTGGRPDDADWPDHVRLTTLDALEADAASAGAAFEPIAAAQEDLAYIIYTGGSTGVPKGVMIRHAAAENTVDDLCERLGLGPDDRVLGLSHLGFDLSVFDVFGVLGRGGTLVLPDPDRLCDPSHWAELASEHRVTIWNSVPAQMQMLVECIQSGAIGRARDIPLRHVMLSGDWIPTDLPDRIWSVMPGVALLSLGGATEASIWSVYHPIQPSDRGRASIPYGRPLRNQALHVLDGGLRPRPDWVAGDLYLAGRGLSDGYVASPDNKAFTRDPESGERLYRTGDVCRYQDDGEVELLGREDLQVKVRGHRIELREIEGAAVMIDGVDAAVAAAIGERENRNLALAIEPAAGADLDPAAIAAQLSRRLPSYMVPQTIRMVSRLPLTGNNKVDRIAAAKLLADRAVAREGGEVGGEEALASPTEQLVARAFASALDASAIGPRADFLDLGGNSLLAARVATEIRSGLEAQGGAILGFDELLIAVLQQRTVRDVSGYIDQSQASSRTGPLVAVAADTAGGRPIAALTLGLGDDERARLRARISTFGERADILSASIRDEAALLEMDAKAMIDRVADAASAELEKHLRGRPLIIVSEGDRAAWGLELGRRLREAGMDDVVLVALGDGRRGGASALDKRWSDALARTVFYPYLGDVLVQHGVRLNADTEWEDVAFGRLSAMAGPPEELLEAALEAVASAA